MDSNLFGSNSTGQLLPVKTPLKDWAFLPNLLPAEWEFPEKLWPLLADAKEALGTLNGIGQTLPSPQLLLKPLQNREALTSSSLEGTYVTPEQLLGYELNSSEPLSANDQRADWKEVSNYNRALIRGCEMLSDLPLCLRIVKEMHQLLMDGVHGQAKSPGEFRSWQVQIGSKGRFIPPPANHVNKLMNNLELAMNKKEKRIDPLVQCFIVHYQFEAIHPFLDGNGRVGRSLLALMIFDWLGHSMPWLYMSAYFEKYKDEYIDNLFKVSTQGAWSDWIEFCLRGAIYQAHDSINRCHQFNHLRSEFHERVDNPSPRTHAIIEGLFNTPVVTISSVAREHEIAYPTAKSDIDRLVKANILAESKKKRNKIFYSYELIDAAYSDQEI